MLALLVGVQPALSEADRAQFVTLFADVVKAMRDSAAHLDECHGERLAEMMVGAARFLRDGLRDTAAIENARSIQQKLTSDDCVAGAQGLLDASKRMLDAGRTLRLGPVVEDAAAAARHLADAIKRASDLEASLVPFSDEISETLAAIEEAGIDLGAPSSSLENAVITAKLMEELRAEARSTGRAAFLGAPIFDD